MSLLTVAHGRPEVPSAGCLPGKRRLGVGFGFLPTSTPRPASRGPGAIRRTAKGLHLSALFQAQFRLIELRVGHGRHPLTSDRELPPKYSQHPMWVARLTTCLGPSMGVFAVRASMGHAFGLHTPTMHLCLFVHARGTHLGRASGRAPTRGTQSGMHSGHPLCVCLFRPHPVLTFAGLHIWIDRPHTRSQGVEVAQLCLRMCRSDI